MKLGVSSYSLHQAVHKGDMTFLDSISWVKENGGEHFEVVPIHFDLVEQPDLIAAIKSKAQSEEIELSNYAIGANFIQPTEQKYEKEIERVKCHVDVAKALGVRFMRHDVAIRPLCDTHIEQYYHDLPLMVRACQEIADYAKPFGITTSVENHGYYLQASDRVQLLVRLVNRDNFKTTLDVGNFLCVDEDPINAVMNNLPFASFIHIKDFYYRDTIIEMGEGWFTSKNGKSLRGAIAGEGDLNMTEVIRIIKQSNYQGAISLEFEGIEDCGQAIKSGLANIRRIWDQV
ncbi:sugar phosphate isomerase/epimerase family protein [Bacillus testis]|uniref:sugar phosphate isomerase/epimerase family protein n=1 Tax=Bacillus testis TaxID=1622072 RepID=UPI00067EED67|nr:sugar phosphate isomerase/epimerase family protein [Bacillus testis]